MSTAQEGKILRNGLATAIVGQPNVGKSSLLNYLLMSALVLIFYHTDYIQGFVTSLGVSNPFTFVVAFVGVQGLIEAIVCFILAGAISRALSAALHRI